MVICLQMIGHDLKMLVNGTLHMGTETGFTGSRSSIWIQCGLASELHTACRLCALHCWTESYASSRNVSHSLDPFRGSVEPKWPCIRKDLHQMRIQGPVWRAPMLL